ncbi:hypothetical protein FOPE_02435 [Fonsecaea pedrosoi]|nr:hypothetical protein FOPE_02435 [Fonsecaea pedrosoi]
MLGCGVLVGIDASGVLLKVTLSPKSVVIVARSLLALTIEPLVWVGNSGMLEKLVVGRAPTSLAGIAEPTPLLVHGVGIGNVEVFGSSSVSP